MPAAYTNLYVEQGTSFSTTITLDDVYGSIYDLTGFVAISQIRKSYYSANATASFVTFVANTTGVITLSLDASVTANIPAGRYVYDTLIIDSTHNTTTRVLEGLIEISPGVTR